MPYKTVFTKEEKARKKIRELSKRGIELLLWPLDAYSDEQVMTALEANGYRWSERHQSWDQFQNSLFA